MDISTYLERINYHGSPAPITQTLHDLQEAHLLTVPFENLSIHLNEPIILEDNALYDKVVNRQRGGFCYELNGLFAALLRSLGFNVTMLSASVHTSEGKYTPVSLPSKFARFPLPKRSRLLPCNPRWARDPE